MCSCVVSSPKISGQLPVVSDHHRPPTTYSPPLPRFRTSNCRPVTTDHWPLLPTALLRPGPRALLPLSCPLLRSSFADWRERATCSYRAGPPSALRLCPVL